MFFTVYIDSIELILKYSHIPGQNKIFNAVANVYTLVTYT